MNFPLYAWLVPVALWAMASASSAVAAGDWQFDFELASSTSLDNPHDIKLSPDRKHLFVSDVGNDRVVVLDATTLEFVEAFGEQELDGTHDVDFDDQGRLYVADTHNGRVAIYTLQGTRGTLSGELTGRMSGPEGVLVHPNGNVYVAGAWSHNVVAYRESQIVHELGGLSAPHDLELAGDGRLWLADAGNDRLLLLSEELEIVAEVRGEPFDFDGVRYLDVLDDGTVIAADKYTHSIKVIDAQRRLVATLGSGKPELGDGVFRTPEGVETDGDIVWFADSGNNRIVRYRYRRPD
ncbi:NHL repeat-containing protein [Thiosocius teredinicola]|uniref:NHL repeat-containing protein n=1 Tax=Thiosocius teredinicola TaxID=1973002 RepID=UPI000990A510